MALPNRHSRRAAAATNAAAPIKGLNVLAEMPEPFPVPSFYGTSVHVASTGNDVMILLSSIQPSYATDAAVTAPVASFHLSRGSAQDLAAVLASILESVEADLGKIDTPFAKEKREGTK